jgi:hypothetical protein
MILPSPRTVDALSVAHVKRLEHPLQSVPPQSMIARGPPALQRPCGYPYFAGNKLHRYALRQQQSRYRSAFEFQNCILPSLFFVTTPG